MRPLWERFVRAMSGATGVMLLVVAPFQCAHDPDPSQVREDSPGEALYALAGEFAKANDKEGRIRTLQYILERYPRSRFALQAQADLKELGVDAPTPAVSVDPNKEGVPLGRLPTDPSASASPATTPEPSKGAP